MPTHPAAHGVRHLAHSAGRDFNEAIGLIEEYLKASVPHELLVNRPPNNPMEQFDMNKGMMPYFLDPACRRVAMQLGWDTTCDLDVHCHLLDEWYQKEAHVYKGHLQDKGVHHSGNKRSGAGWQQGMPEEIIEIHLDEIDVRQFRHYFGPSPTHSAALPPPCTRRVTCSA